MERTFVMIKPDGVQRSIIGQIIGRFESKGLKIIGMKMIHVSRDLAATHYAEHEGKKFYESLMKFITSGPVVTMVIQGDKAVSIVRTMVGVTNPKEASPGTIRGDYGIETGRNIIHASDSPESAVREISIFYDQDELMVYSKINEIWVYE